MLKTFLPSIAVTLIALTGLIYIITNTTPEPKMVGIFLLFLLLFVSAVSFIPLSTISRKKMEHPRQHYKNTLRRSLIIGIGLTSLLILHLTKNFQILQITLVLVILILLEVGLSQHNKPQDKK